MRIGRTIIIPAILALGVAGSALSAPATSAASGHAPSAHVLAAAGIPTIWYRA
jgi:hypothetical protein